VEAVKAINPVGVFIATGGTPIVPPIPGLDGDNVMTAEEVLTGKKTPVGEVAVIGGGITGMEVAETLLAKGHKTTIVEMLPGIGLSLYRSVLADYQIRTAKMGGITVRDHERLLGVAPGGIKTMNSQTNAITTMAADTVVLALGTKPNNALTAEFQAAFDEVIVLGDANRSGRIVEAAYDGYSRATTF